MDTIIVGLGLMFSPFLGGLIGHAIRRLSFLKTSERTAFAAGVIIAIAIALTLAALYNLVS